MTTKMTISALAAVSLIGACYKRPYYPAGGPGPADFSGTYYAKESLYFGSCLGLTPRKEKFTVEVDHHPAGALTLKMTAFGMPWDARVQRDGNFTTAAVTIQGAEMTTTTTISGRFGEAGFTARVIVNTIEPIRTARPPEPTTRACNYQFRWEAEKQ